MISLASGKPRSRSKVRGSSSSVLWYSSSRRMFGLHFWNGPLSVDEMVVENFLERHERVPGLLLEDAVAAAGQSFVVKSVALSSNRSPTPVRGDFLIVGDDVPPPLQLAGDDSRPRR